LGGKETTDLMEKTISSERIYEGRTINLRRDTVELPDGRHAQREIVEHPGAVSIVPILEDGTVILVKQFRAPINKVTLEIPAGKLEPGETPEHCAARELAEETGYRAGRLEHKGTFYTTPGFSDEIMYLYLATDLRPVDSQPDFDEFLAGERIGLEKLLEMAEQGKIIDAKTLVGIYTAARFFLP
jgi:ADP-ribose pyrophosphatase